MKKSVQLSKTEIKMMNEISQVFAKYKNRTRQFGLQLSHSHFSVGKDEILYETHDKQNRTLITKPVKKNTIANALATTWEINEKGEIKVMSLCCDVNPPVDAPAR